MRHDTIVTLTIPAELRFVAMARVTAAGLAAEFDFTVEEIEDLRMGVDELVTVLVEHAGDESLTLTYGISDQGTFTLSAESPPGTDFDSLIDELTRRIIAAVVDDLECQGGRCTLRKKRSRS